MFSSVTVEASSGSGSDLIPKFNLPSEWSSRSRYDLHLCGECISCIAGNIHAVFVTSSEAAPLRSQDCLTLLLECIGNVILCL